MKKTFAILGAGMQGTAAAYDLVKFADPERIKMGDRDQTQAQKNAHRVNSLTDTNLCEAFEVDALDPKSLATFLEDVDVVLSCVPYWMHPKVAKVCIETNTHMVDMGGDTNVTMETMKLDEQAKSKGVTVIPDTGLAPGLVNDLGNYIIETLDETEAVKLYCGGLPQNPKPPFNYRLVFNVEGLVTEYTDEATVLRDEQIVMVPTLEEAEKIEIDGLGEMEAFVTSGGTSTAPHTHQGSVKNYEYKTIRFPGHCERMKIFKDFGFWDQEKVTVHGEEVEPRELFHVLMAERLRDDSDKDQVVVRGAGVGTKNGQPYRIQMDIHCLHDDATGFSAMEQMTGYSTAIYAAAVARGDVPGGVVRYETAINGRDFVDAMRKRGIDIKVQEGPAS